MIKEFNRVNRVNGELKLPGDKSISHRAVMIACMADGVSVIKNLSSSEDVNSTIKCFEQLGCNFEKNRSTLKVYGKGFKGFNRPTQTLDCGNSGTTARLLTGILSAQDFESELVGDQSLSKRPMQRIVEPLRKMNANIFTSNSGTLPLKIYPSVLKPIEYEMPVASAQVKSSILFAALHLNEESTVIENFSTRDHTEKMLGLRTSQNNSMKKIYSSKKYYPSSFVMNIPSDISSASFFMVLALLLPESELLLKNISLNPTRIGVIKLLKEMGGNIEILNASHEKNEEIGDVIVKSSKLRNVEIDKAIIPNIIDEIPILSIAGVFAEGSFKITNARELRFKESDRIKALCENYKLAGLKVDEFDDGFVVNGNLSNETVMFNSYNDHRIAMAFAILSTLLPQGGKVTDFECVKISNPSFLEQLSLIAS
ncbi:3-phosphoshikimate 1-carboxyvinyltransferase [Melioribacteraceae bacterium 4301-Me]|uniref:3-phosphoshikimate 1-carboxyvinyltransferase n=1 Tax=Pyranulibacter aquaticus TaxID=3163344 RepID=UPI00359BA86B